MHTSTNIWLRSGLAVLLAVSILTFEKSSFPQSQAEASLDVPVVKGGAGPCTVDFVVRDSAGKGVYDAKIHIQIKYGFGGFHRLEPSAGTNFEGKARFEGLPERIKGTAEFDVTKGDRAKTVPYDPQADCHPRHEVTLGEKQ
jgi:hypothetical protein